jgi:phage shock protein E
MNSKNILWGIIAMLTVHFITACNNDSSAPKNKSSETQKQQPNKYASAFLVDVRTPEEFAEGSVAGAVNIPLSEVANRIADFKGKKQMVVFCRSGSRSSQAIEILEKNGIVNVINGGSWQDVNNSIK